MKRIKNEQGLTLVELLAVIVIGGFMAALTGTIIINALKTQHEVTLDTQLRDEADWYMVSMMNALYTMQESTVCEDQTIDATDTTSVGGFIKTGADCSATTGFIKNSTTNEWEIYVNGQVLPAINKKIKIVDPKLYKKNGNQYKIILTLQLQSNDTRTVTKEFDNVVQSIPKVQ